MPGPEIAEECAEARGVTTRAARLGSLPPSDGDRMCALGGADVAVRLRMANCETCGNEYDKYFTVTMRGRAHVFDSFECAIQALAPRCDHCRCTVVGHGVEVGGKIFCCAHCARERGETVVTDRAV
jgi:hypothetical protein